MLTYNCENTELEQQLRRMETLARDAGSSFSERVVVCEKNGDFSVETEGPADQSAPLMTIAHECLIPVDQVTLELEGDDLVIREMGADWSDTRRRMCEMLVDFYNMSGKIKQCRQTSPKIALLDFPAVQERILAAQTDQLLIGIRNQVERKGVDFALIHAFLRSRTSVIKLPGDAGFGTGMIPFLELMNHQLAGAPFQVVDQGQQVMEQKCIAGSDECFSHYGMLGAMDSFILYGFVDQRAGIVRSVPITIDLPDLGKIRVLGNQARYNQLLPERLRDLQNLFPTIGLDDGVVTASCLVIPDRQRPRALARVLAPIIGNMAEQMGVKPHPDSLKLAEAQVILENLRFYKDLKAFLADPANVAGLAEPLLAEARRATDHQLARIREYSMAT